VAANKRLHEQIKRAPKDAHAPSTTDEHKRSEKAHSRSPTRLTSSAAGGRSSTPLRQEEAHVLFAAEREKTRLMEGRVLQLQLQIERLQEQLLTSQKLNDKNKKDCIEAETKSLPRRVMRLFIHILTWSRYANVIMSHGQALKKRTQDLEAQVAAACSDRDSMKQQLEEVRAQAAASLSLHASQLKAKSGDVQRMEASTEQLRATYVKRFKKLEDALQQVQ
jgi:TolA-binding protein